MPEKELDEFKRTVMALASAPEVQDQLFPDFVCKGDELVVEFDDALVAWRNNCAATEAQRRAVASLDFFINEHSGVDYSETYTERSSLFVDPIWVKIRALSYEVLEAFEWNYETPKPNANNSYVPDKK